MEGGRKAGEVAREKIERTETVGFPLVEEADRFAIGLMRFRPLEVEAVWIPRWRSPKPST